MVKLTVNRQWPLRFSEEIKADYSKFEIREQNEIATKVSSFTIDDLMFFEAPSKETLKLSEFRKMLLDRDCTPLDVYCARAIYENKEAMWQLYNLWNRFTIHTDRSINSSTIAFLGSIVARPDDDADHFSTFKYYPMAILNKVDFTPFEDDPFFRKDQDFILVFKEEFILNM